VIFTLFVPVEIDVSTLQMSYKIYNFVSEMTYCC